MRLIHTSDWHLGRSFHGVGLLAAQARYLDHLVDVVRTESVDAVVVAGDVYDRALPPVDAVQLLSEALGRLRDAGAEVVLAPGNHDSAARLGFGSPLLERAGVHIRSGVSDLARPLLVGGVAIYPLPYLDPTSVSVTTALGATARSHTAVLRAALAQVHGDAAQRNEPAVVAAHCFVGGGASSDSERDISTGGVSVVPAELFDGIAYTALGHLHRPQQVGEHVRYSGSPVAMSFSEAGQTKGSLLVTLEGGQASAESLAAPVERALATVRGRLDDVLHDRRHADAEECYVQVTLTDPVRPARAMEQVRRRFAHALNLVFEPEGGIVRPRSVATRAAGRTPGEVCHDFVSHVRGAGPTTQEAALLAEGLERSRLDRARRDDEGQAADGVAASAQGAA